MMDTVNKASSPLVCKLTDKEFANRIEYLRTEIFSHVKQINELPDGYEYVFEQPAAFYLKVTEFIVYERQCCPFFHFSLNFEPEAGAVNLRLYGSGN